MKRLLYGGTVVNVFTGELEKVDVLIKDEKIIGVGEYNKTEADVVEDITGKFLCPGFIDGHIHIESTMLTPYELSKIVLSRGTTAIVADPHEIANVCGVDGIKYMIEASTNIPFSIYFMLPSCVPATPFDESGATLEAKDIKKLYKYPQVLGLAEMMNYPGVIYDSPSVHAKINDAIKLGKLIDGHAPCLLGKELDKYISAGIRSDHECSNISEAIEKIKKGQWIMIRQGTAARNLNNLLGLFEAPYNSRCILVTDDRHPLDLMTEGHIDNIIRLAVKNGKSVITAIQMATIQAAQCFGISYVGAVAPGYRANLVVLNDLNSVDIEDVYYSGEKVVTQKQVKIFDKPKISPKLFETVNNSFHVNKLDKKDFYIKPKSKKCRVIEILPGQLITNEKIFEINWDKDNGVDLERDILKLAVIERHKNTGHNGLGFISGIGLKKGAIASSVSHDSHNIIVIGTNDIDMAIAANHIRKNGGNVVVSDEEVVASLPLPIAGLMTDLSGEKIIDLNKKIRVAVYKLGVSEKIEPFMNMAFVSLSVIPSIKMTTKGLIDVNKQEIVSLYYN
ncbi:MAG: adenine deaminase [Oscillospiraceae bacterium]|nr:adenine deaminase [Oscillospiraceae bacterium]